MRSTFVALALIAALPSAPDTLQDVIAVRPDVADALYLAMGARFPSVVRVGARGGDGTLIAPNWVLTAGHVAHGVTRRSNGDLRIFVQGLDDGLPVAQVILHPGFEPMGSKDLALIRLVRPVERVAPAPLYRKREELGKEIVIVGHGDTKTGRGGDWLADGKRRGATNVIDNVTAQHIMFDFDPPGEATALEGTAGPGDSGGPAFIEADGSWHAAGISSLGEPGAEGPGTYGAREHYVRVSSYLEWIDETMASPPEARLVNFPTPGVSNMGRGPSPGPPGVVVLEEIGLLVSERDGQVRMAGRIDELFPDEVLRAGIRPPAVVTRLNGQPIESLAVLQRRFAEIPAGAQFHLEFEHEGKTHQFELTK